MQPITHVTCQVIASIVLLALTAAGVVMYPAVDVQSSGSGELIITHEPTIDSAQTGDQPLESFNDLTPFEVSDCTGPCFLGIVPGETVFADALDTVSAYIPTEQFHTTYDTGFWFYDKNGKQIDVVFKATYPTLGNTVCCIEIVSYRGDGAFMTLGDILHMGYIPDRVFRGPICGLMDVCLMVTFANADSHLIARFGVKDALNEATSISHIMLVTAESFETHLSDTIIRTHYYDEIPWLGFAPTTDYVNAIPLPEPVPPARGYRLRSTLYANHCTIACWNGFEPFVVSRDVVEGWLSGTLQDYSVATMGIENNTLVWHLTPDNPFFNPAAEDEPTIMMEFSAENILWRTALLDIHVCADTVISTYGRPPLINVDQQNIRFGYPADGLMFSMHKGDTSFPYAFTSIFITSPEWVEHFASPNNELWETIAAQLSGGACEDRFTVD